LSQRLEHLAFLAHRGACHAHAHSHLAEPFSDQEIAAFNSKL
jgi:hypothetical protein